MSKTEDLLKEILDHLRGVHRENYMSRMEERAAIIRQELKRNTAVISVFDEDLSAEGKMRITEAIREARINNPGFIIQREDGDFVVEYDMSLYKPL